MSTIKKSEKKSMPDTQSYSTWDVPSDRYEVWLKTLPTKEEIQKLKAAGRSKTTAQTVSEEFDKRLKAFRPTNSSKTLKRSVGR